ncbi:MAG: hypothetical protein AAB291_00490, partial [Chloroflexota bacterium]
MMVKDIKHIDVRAVPELLSIAEEVRKTKEPCLLKRGSEDMAIVMPIKATRERRRVGAKTEADYEAFRSAAGSWADVNTDKL